uniref:Chalcone-flavonone isomerase family protein n=1 Tax=Adiantum capillus-veneris TaxID=13818 RepID=A0A4Y6I289_ADICA|nr:chalcone isomerase [Adiantum capillus-veneris]
MTDAVENKQVEFGALEVEGIKFAPSVAALGSTKQLVLGGAGFRGLEISGNLVKFTAIGIYVDEAIIPHLSPKLHGKSIEELCNNELLFEEVLAAPFEKLVRVVFLLPLTGPQYSEKVVERMGLLPNPGIKEESTKQFLEIFKPENFPPRTSLICSFTEEALKVAFMKTDDFPEDADAVIEDKWLARAFLASIIGKDGVSPLAKLSFAERMSRCL